MLRQLLNRSKTLSINKKLAGVGLFLSSMAMISSFVSPNGLNDVNEKPEFISVVELAEKIKRGDHFLLIDLRSSDKFQEFHLPTAENRSIQSVLEMGDVSIVVFYSGDDHLSRKLWEALPEKAKANARILYGGVHDWYEKLLYPKIPLEVKKEHQPLVNTIIELSTFYGGQPEFIEGKAILNYYQYDLREAYWPKSHRENGIVRKGC